MRRAKFATLAFALFASGAALGQLSTSPASVDFGGQSMSTTSPPLTVTVTNNGTGSVTVSNVAVGNAQFAQTNDCTTLAAAASCAVHVTFTPAIVAGDLTAEFPVSSNLTITSDAPGSPNGVPLAGIAERSLVTHYYRSILRRPPDASGKKFWRDDVLRMAGLDASVNEAWFAMAQFFYFSAEYRGLNRDDTGFVTDLYNTFFNRPPDSGGLAFWLDQLSQGMPREVILAQFMFSNEFAAFTTAIFGSPVVRPEVDMAMDFYRGMLARLPEDGGLMTYAEQMRAAQCAGPTDMQAMITNMFFGFLSGNEYRGKSRSNAQYVGDLYNTLLRRGGDLAGVQFFVNQLNGGTDRGAVALTFLNSPEFAARVDSIEAAGCLSRGASATVPQTPAVPGISVVFGGDALPLLSYMNGNGDPSGIFLQTAHCSDPACASGFLATALDGPFGLSTTRAGRASDGLPFIGYLGSSNGQGALYSVKCGAAACDGLNTFSFLEGVGFQRNELSMADGVAAPDGRPLFVYSAPGLIVEKCADATCLSSTRLGFGQGIRGGVAIGTDGFPVIAYDKPGAGIQVIKCGNAACSSGNAVSAVDPETSERLDLYRDVSMAVAVAIGSDGFPVLAYQVLQGGSMFSRTRAATKVLKCGNAACSSGNVLTEIDPSQDGFDISLVVPTDGRPLVAYVTTIQKTLKVVRCGNAACSAGNTATTIPGLGTPMVGASMTLGPSGKPFLAVSVAQQVKTLACTNADCR